ncbi:cyclic nucleotide-binding domain-containing protein [Candidatus Marimicrobium litorale]|uniref:Cyclic nucleotide-binding domain-containing protein n=1 Tax=Candidatus Marimicrobium litorale TaxID=2518991 RepID=A0ABT3T7U1_9GAMM|nr:cyclic nucleotide-binding domain-containing protein [Candidatus Marimicrobium litorale]MCX2978343.1 cyclic nucleotide-binding domain-containing protein [Candidatus Marimicrobium litorale]
MFVNIDAQDIAALSQQFGTLVGELLEVVNMRGQLHDIEITPAGNFRGFDDRQFYVILDGSVSARYQGKSIYTLETGDMLLPDVTGGLDTAIAVEYASDTGASLRSYPALEFMQRVFDEPVAIRLWTRLLVTYAGLVTRIAAAGVNEPPATPGFESYSEGQIIIRQGDEADYVYYMRSGEAEVLVSGVNVAIIGEGEIFGAMAVLTCTSRSATVRARTACAVDKVPKDQFTELIKSNPATINSLMVDMANSIVNLNEQLAGSRVKAREERRQDKQ